jgi:hypothetical protein
MGEEEGMEEIYFCVLLLPKRPFTMFRCVPFIRLPGGRMGPGKTEVALKEKMWLSKSRLVPKYSIGKPANAWRTLPAKVWRCSSLEEEEVAREMLLLPVLRTVHLG